MKFRDRNNVQHDTRLGALAASLTSMLFFPDLLSSNPQVPHYNTTPKHHENNNGFGEVQDVDFQEVDEEDAGTEVEGEEEPEVIDAPDEEPKPGDIGGVFVGPTEEGTTVEEGEPKLFFTCRCGIEKSEYRDETRVCKICNTPVTWIT